MEMLAERRLAWQPNGMLQESVPDDHPECPIIDHESLIDIIQDLLGETFGLQAGCDILDRRDEEVHVAVVMPNHFHVGRDIDDPAILPHEALTRLKACLLYTSRCV